MWREIIEVYKLSTNVWEQNLCQEGDEDKAVDSDNTAN
jgi:hypothetical protein